VTIDRGSIFIEFSTDFNSVNQCIFFPNSVICIEKCNFFKKNFYFLVKLIESEDKKYIIRFRAAGLACCLAGAWQATRPSTRPGWIFEILAWPDQAIRYSAWPAGQVRPKSLAWI
jgi:hypothetical protein